MLTKKSILTLFLFLILSSISAHEFWLSPEKFIYKRTETINLRFRVGENFEGDNWKGNNERIQLLRFYYGGVSDDLSKYITDAQGDSVQLTMIDEGTCMIAFNSTNSYIETEADKFNEYLKEDGLNNAIEYRSQNNESDSIGREHYQRCAKTLFQVGDIKDKTYAMTTGMPVDIFPANNPYQLKNNDSLKVKILYNQMPLAGTLVKIWSRENNQTEKTELTTNEAGEILFPVKTTGLWMVSVVKMERLDNDPVVQWQSYWGNLTWGYE